MAASQKAEEVAEEQAQQESMPDSEQKGQDIADSQEEVQETEESLEAPAGESEEGELPKGVSERTREQFEKLKASLRQAKEALFRKESSPVVTEEPKPIYDKATGLVDVEALTDLQKRAYEAERRAKETEQKIQQQTWDNQVNEFYEAHPDLRSPKTKEAKEAYDEAERLWLHSQAYPEKYSGYALSQKQAGDLAKKRMGEKPETPKEEAQRVESKEQASLGASGQPTQGVQSKITSEEEIQRLQFGTRIGDKGAMIARMRAIREAQAEASK